MHYTAFRGEQAYAEIMAKANAVSFMADKKESCRSICFGVSKDLQNVLAIAMFNYYSEKLKTAQEEFEKL